MENRIIENGLEYTLVGDYYLPNLTLPNEPRTIGKWGRMHRDYIKEHRPILFNRLCLDGALWTYLADLNEQAQTRLDMLINQMAAAEGITEALKDANQMEWVRRMNSIRSRAEEIILHKLVYGEDVV